MKYIKLYNESVGDNFYYHYVDPSKIFNILKINKFNLSSHLGDKFTNMKRFFYLALSRTPNAKLGYARMRNSRIVFKKNELKSKYKIEPYDYWNGDSLSGKNPEKYQSFTSGVKRLHQDMNMRNEYEDRLISNNPVINSINNYIERVDLLYKEDADRANIYIYRVFNLCKELGIKAFVYSNVEDMSYGRNAMADNTDSLDFDDDEEEYKGTDWENGHFDFNMLIALILFDFKYMSDNGGYELCLKDAESYIMKHDIAGADAPKVYDKMRNLYNRNSDVVEGIRADLHNFFHSGKSGPVRDKVVLLTNEMRRCNVRTLDELVDYKVLGKLSPTTPKKDWSSTYQFAKWTKYYGDTSEEDKIAYVPISNDTPFNKLQGFYYYSYKHNGYFYEDEFEVLRKMDEEGKPISSVINYLFNRYTPQRAIKKINDSSWDSYDKVFRYKIVMI